jgi:hypothetical protein
MYLLGELISQKRLLLDSSNRLNHYSPTLGTLDNLPQPILAPKTTMVIWANPKDYINSTLAISSDRSGHHSILPLLNKTDN